MKAEEFKKITEEISEKIGEEKSSLIADNFATIISDNIQMNKTIDDKQKEIEKLTKDKEDLMKTNMNLLQQIPMGTEEDISPQIKKEEPKRKASAFDYKEVLDEYGNFKK